MPITSQGLAALRAYVADAARTAPDKRVLYKALSLSPAQQIAVEAALGTYWGREQYPCPDQIDLRPKHGYESRVIKDGFSGDQYIEWLRLGCSIEATVTVDGNGRPRLTLRGQTDFSGYLYDLHVPLRSDTHGYIHVDGVVPDGLPSGAKKNAALSANP